MKSSREHLRFLKRAPGLSNDGLPTALRAAVPRLHDRLGKSTNAVAIGMTGARARRTNCEMKLAEVFLACLHAWAGKCE